MAVCREPLVKYRLQASGASHHVVRMNNARTLVVGRALQSPRGRGLTTAQRRRVWANTWATNAWDAARHGRILDGLAADAKAIAWWPFSRAPYAHVVRTLLGRA